MKTQLQLNVITDSGDSFSLKSKIKIHKNFRSKSVVVCESISGLTMRFENMRCCMRKRNEDEELSVLVFLEIDREDEQFT
jgi:hypothetical protein